MKNSISHNFPPSPPATPPAEKRKFYFYCRLAFSEICSQNVCSQLLCPLTPPLPNQQSDGFPLEFLLKDLKQNCEHAAKLANKPSKKLRTNRIMNKRAFLIPTSSHGPPQRSTPLSEHWDTLTTHKLLLWPNPPEFPPSSSRRPPQEFSPWRP